MSLQPLLSLITIVLVGRAFQILYHTIWVEIKEYKVNALIFLYKVVENPTNIKIGEIWPTVY